MKNPFSIFITVFILVIVSPSLTAQQPYLAETWNYSSKQILSGLTFTDLSDTGRLSLISAGSSDGFVYALKYDGLLKWKYPGGGYVHAINADKDRVFAAYGRNLYVLNSDGERIGEYHGGQLLYGASIRNIVPANFDEDEDKEVALTIYDPQTCPRKKQVVGVGVTPTERIWVYEPPGNYFPLVLDAGDLDGDKVDETVTGLVARGLTQGSCTPVYDHESMIIAIDSSGEVLWEYDTDTAVTSLSVSDLDGDGIMEVIAGCYSELLIIEGDGKLKCRYDTATRVDSLTTTQLDGTDGLEIAFGAENLYALKNDCSLLWIGQTGSRVYSLSTGYLDGYGIR